MHRRTIVGLALGLLPASGMAQVAPPLATAPNAPSGPPVGRTPMHGRGAQQHRAQQHQEVLGQNFEALPQPAKDRVTSAFRQGQPDLPLADVQARWDAMTSTQRGEVLTMHERRMGRHGRPASGTGPGRGPGPAAPPG
jgi:hypothetical protein